MRKLTKHLWPVALAGLMLTNAGSNSIQADVIIAQWNFNSPVPDTNTGTGTTTPSIGSGTASLVGGTTAIFASGDASGGSSDPAVGDDSGWGTTTYPAQGTGNKSAGAQFNVDTTGFDSILVTWDTRASNSSARHQQFQYSTDGTTFNDFGSLFVNSTGDTWFNLRSVDLSSIPAVNNNPLFAIRLVSAFDPANDTSYTASGTTYATTGTLRHDMVTVSSITAIPEPTGLSMLSGVGVMVVFARRRRPAV